MKNSNIIVIMVVVFVLGVALGIGISNISVDTATDTINTPVINTNNGNTNTKASNVNLNPGFCGWSTNEDCSADSDCEAAGCSGQVCHLKDGKESIFTTCEAKECYSDEKYEVECGFSDKKCQWRNK